MTYKQIQEYCKKKYGFCPKTCHIAHVKEIMKLIPKNSKRKHKCPEYRINFVKSAITNYNDK